MSESEDTGSSREIPLKPLEPRAVPVRGPALAAVVRGARPPAWPVPEEVTGRSFLVVLALLGIIGLLAYVMKTYSGGANAGVDQNGYMMTARLITGDKNAFAPEHPPATPPGVIAQLQEKAGATQAATGSAMTQPGRVYATDDLELPRAAQTWPMFDVVRNRLSYVQESPFQFAGRMNIFTEPYGPIEVKDGGSVQEHRVYAKYPFGFPLLAAIGRWIYGLDGMYLVNPLCTVLACYFAYFLFRQVVSPFMGLMGVLWLACNPLALMYGIDANSHASTLLCVVIGFWGVLSWLRLGEKWRALVGGLALGYACTIRYSEFLLVLPVVFAAIVNLRFGKNWDKKRWRGSLTLLLGWAIPVLVLAGVCWVCFGLPWKTGYTYCHEDTGFSWKYLSGDFGKGLAQRQGNWETFLDQINNTGLYIMWPFALVGLLAMIGSAWRLGVTMALWILPSTGLYMLYYWAPQGPANLGYMRFFISILPGMILAGLWILERGLVHLRGEKWSSLILVTLLGVVLWLCAAMYGYTEQPVIGLKIFAQLPMALWHYVTSLPGAIGTGVILALVAGVWMWDRELAPSRTCLALGAAAITAVGCGRNLARSSESLENSYARQLGVREMVDLTTSVLPRGSVLFANDGLENQLDVVGWWKLYPLELFNTVGFADYKRRAEMHDKDREQEEDPDPLQAARASYYMKLLGRQNASGQWVARNNDDLRGAENAIIERQLSEGRRVAFLVTEREDRQGRPTVKGTLPVRAGYELKELVRWVTMMPVRVARGPGGMMGMGGRNGRRPEQPEAVPGRALAYQVIYELVDKNRPVAPVRPVVPVTPVNPPTPPTVPVEPPKMPGNQRPPEVPSTRKTIFDMN